MSEPFTLSQHLANYLKPINHLGLWLTAIIVLVIAYVIIYKALYWLSYKIWPLDEEPDFEEEQNDESDVT